MKNRLNEIENSKSDSSRMFWVIKEIQRQKPNIPLLIKTETGGFTINEKEQVEIIATHFKKQFSKNTQVLNKIHTQPTAMKQPFTAEEIKKAIRSLRNNRSAGEDQIKAEMLKSAPDILHELLADIYNNISETGKHPPVLTLSIVTPIQKPAKPKGPVQNLRPITLLSMIRKVLAVRMKRRIVDKLNAEIPPSQAAYRAGRSTTEHVFAAKVLVEKAITSANYPIHLLMLDMSKAFDTVNQSKLMQELAKVLNPDELHIKNVLTNTQLKIRWGKEKSDAFEADTRVPQGDCMSTNLFTFYLAKALGSNKHDNHDYYSTTVKPLANITNDHEYAYIKEKINLNMEYADDMSHISSDMRNIEYAEKTLPSKLSSWDLIMNEGKTEEFNIRETEKKHGANVSCWERC